LVSGTIVSRTALTYGRRSPPEFEIAQTANLQWHIPSHYSRRLQASLYTTDERKGNKYALEDMQQVELYSLATFPTKPSSRWTGAIQYSYNPPCRRATSYSEIGQRLSQLIQLRIHLTSSQCSESNIIGSSSWIHGLQSGCADVLPHTAQRWINGRKGEPLYTSGYRRCVEMVCN
jgi:hypothetical protein